MRRVHACNQDQEAPKPTPPANLDHTQFRQYSSQFGRWMHPDPAGLAAADPYKPQSWNRYAYVLNSPMNLIDPLGLNCKLPDGQIVDDDVEDCESENGTWTNAPLSGGDCIWCEDVPIGPPLDTSLIIMNLLPGGAPDAYGPTGVPLFIVYAWGLPWPDQQFGPSITPVFYVPGGGLGGPIQSNPNPYIVQIIQSQNKQFDKCWSASNPLKPKDVIKVMTQKPKDPLQQIGDESRKQVDKMNACAEQFPLAILSDHYNGLSPSEAYFWQEWFPW